MNGGVGLDVILVGVGLQAVAPQRRDNAWVTELPNPSGLPMASTTSRPWRHWNRPVLSAAAGQIQFQHGQVGGRVGADDHRRAGRAPVMQQDLDGVHPAMTWLLVRIWPCR